MALFKNGLDEVLLAARAANRPGSVLQIREFIINTRARIRQPIYEQRRRESRGERNPGVCRMVSRFEAHLVDKPRKIEINFTNPLQGAGFCRYGS